MAPVLSDESSKLASIAFNLSNLLYKAFSEVLNELYHLLSNTEQHITNIIFPIFDHHRNELIILNDRFSHMLYLFEALKLTLVAMIDKVYFSFINKTLYAFIDRLFVGPKVER